MGVIEKLRRYKELKAEIKMLELDIEDLKDEVGPEPISFEERSSPTHKFSSVTENQAISCMTKVYELEAEKKVKERQILRIDNALSILDEKERTIIESIHVKGLRWDSVTFSLDRTYSYCKKIEKQALRKIEKFL